MQTAGRHTAPATEAQRRAGGSQKKRMTLLTLREPFITSLLLRNGPCP
jgi:hypothetical protein